MTANPPKSFAEALARIPLGTTQGLYLSTRYVTTRSLFNTGRSTKLIAEELGGADYISLNFYHLKSGPRLKPCEMSADKVIAFVFGYRPDTAFAKV